jgi:hypothetical protein
MRKPMGDPWLAGEITLGQHSLGQVAELDG